MRGQVVAATELGNDNTEGQERAVKRSRVREEASGDEEASTSEQSKNKHIKPSNSSQVHNASTGQAINYSSQETNVHTSQADKDKPSKKTSCNAITSQAKQSLSNNKQAVTSQVPVNNDKPSLATKQAMQPGIEEDWESSTVTTAEETKWDSDGSDSDWEDVDEPENDSVAKQSSPQYTGLEPPRLESGVRISGANKRQLRRENKKKRQQRQLDQAEQTYWSIYKGDFELPEAKEELESWRNMMCPRGLALHHPAAAKLLQYATGGCPANTGQNFSTRNAPGAQDSRALGGQHSLYLPTIN
jgi:hypothetical protein